MKANLLISGAIIAIFLLACAKQAPPPGGPVDRTPPKVIHALPQPGQTATPLDSEISIEFSERIDRRSVEESVFISPIPEQDIRFKWKGSKVVMKFPGGLKPDKTYVLTIGTDTKDMRNNRMTNSYTMAFSTGDSIDQALVKGRVYSETPVKGALVWAYSLTENSQPNPVEIKAEYITQCGDDGTYRLSHLSYDNYRLFAVNDRNGNRLYDPEYDLIGICTRDVRLNADTMRADDCNFQLSREDTTRPGLLRAMAQDQHHLTLQFDEQMSSKNIDSLSSYLIERITNDSPAEALRIRLVYQNPADKSRVDFITDAQVAQADYEVRVERLTDLSGNKIDPEYQTISFTGSTAPDTLKPMLIASSPKDSSFSIPLNAAIELYFTEAMDQNSLEKHFSLTDTLERKIPGKLSSLAPSAFRFVADAQLQSKMTYFVKLPVDSVFDLFDNPSGDSALSITFTTLNKDTLTSISGTVYDEVETDSGKIHLRASLVKTGNLQYYEVLDKPGAYAFNSILPGLYLLYGFRDEDGNGAYSFGSILPFKPAEQFIFYPDTLKTRSRWSNEGNDFVLKR
ncbi:Ig-like domain-containing protein [candidate division KSB1 bacterium]|nr:Ig-like domain-containing protein [candidate division KSB1 bacterium]